MPININAVQLLIKLLYEFYRCLSHAASPMAEFRASQKPTRLGHGRTTRYTLLDYPSVLAAIAAYGQVIFDRHITWAGMTCGIISKSQTEMLP